MTTPSISEPCRAKYARDGKHAMRGAICRNCGARDEEKGVDPTPWLVLEAAQREFLKASQTLDQSFSWTDKDEKLAAIIDWRNRFSDLKTAEEAFK